MVSQTVIYDGYLKVVESKKVLLLQNPKTKISHHIGK